MATGSRSATPEATTGSDVTPCVTVRLERHMGLVQCIGVTCGLIIGAGIYVAPKGIMLGAGSAGLALILWAVSGLAAILGGLCYAELGTTFPESGEKYTYLREAFGPFAAFMYLWMYMLLKRPGSNSVKILLSGNYALQPLYEGCVVDQWAVRCLAICIAYMEAPMAISRRDVDQTQSRVHLKRRLDLHHGVGIICGLIIGSGIYVAPKGVLAGSGSPGLALLLWAVCGIAAIFGALCFAELGTTFMTSGEKYAYLREMYGPFASFMYLWMYMVLIRPGSNAIKAVMFGYYTLQPLYSSGDCVVDQQAASLVALCLPCLLTFINVVRVKWAAHGQTFFTSISVLALIIISITGLVWIGKGHTEHLERPFEGTTHNPADIVLALYSGIFASWGWNALNFMVEELKDPYKNLPRAIYISMFLVTVLYVFVNLAYITVLGPEGILASDAVAVTFAQKTLGPAAWIMSVFIALNTAGSYNSGTLVASRLCFVGARRGHLPEVLALINIKFLSPITSLIFQCCLVIIMCWTVDLYTLLNNLVFANTFFDALTVAGMLYLRWKKPELERPLKIPIIIPIIFLMFTIVLVCIPLLLKPRATGIGLLIILCTGVPYYVIFVMWESKPRKLAEWRDKFLVWVQKLLYCVKQEGEHEKTF